uniref:Glycosyl transferase 48 domain-containing protein n=1 Tax=Leersia perrieri TaxID=77586 RepID=A0A0D9WVW5_9ORYZ
MAAALSSAAEGVWSTEQKMFPMAPPPIGVEIGNDWRRAEEDAGDEAVGLFAHLGEIRDMNSVQFFASVVWEDQVKSGGGTEAEKRNMEQLKNEGLAVSGLVPTNLLFVDTIVLPDEDNSTFYKQVWCMHTILTSSSMDFMINVPKNLEAHQRITFFSNLLNAKFMQLQWEVEIYHVKLPGPLKLGEGELESQNHAIIFTKGHAVQTIDLNQDNYFEEALKMRNLLEFNQDYGIRKPKILGVRKHVFTSSVSSLACFMSAQETVVYQLHITGEYFCGPTNGTSMYQIKIQPFIDHANLKQMVGLCFGTSSNEAHMYRHVHAIIVGASVASNVLLLEFTKIPFVDTFTCLLAFLPTGWGIISIALVFKPYLGTSYFLNHYWKKDHMEFEV